MDKQFYVYILASKRNGTLYTGVTSNLVQRVWQHKQKIVKGFTIIEPRNFNHEKRKRFV